MPDPRHLICICCPKGCPVTAELEEGEILSLSGYSCPRGEQYAKDELTHPVRMVTTSLPVKGGDQKMVSVKTSRPVPREMIHSVMEALRRTAVSAPVSIGDVLIRNLAGCGADILATRNVKEL